jgi:CRP/FNR family transcriptional regulator, cyclic AMP receptor protein
MMSFFDYPDTEPKGARAGAPPQAAVLLPDASEADWATLLEFTRALRFGTGQEILAAGSGGRSLYLLLEGTLEILAPPARFGRQRRIGRLEAGSLVGEVSFFDGVPRSAGVRALTPVVIAEMTLQDFERLADRHPGLARSLLLDLGRILAGRLRQAEAAHGPADREAV